MAAVSLHRDANIAYIVATMRSERRGEKTKGSIHDLSTHKSGIVFSFFLYFVEHFKRSPRSYEITMLSA